MNCPTCGRSHSECHCTARAEFEHALGQCGFGRDTRLRAHDTKSPARVLYVVAFNATVIATVSAVAVGGRLAWVWWMTR